MARVCLSLLGTHVSPPPFLATRAERCNVNRISMQCYAYVCVERKEERHTSSIVYYSFPPPAEASRRAGGSCCSSAIVSDCQHNFRPREDTHTHTHGGEEEEITPSLPLFLHPPTTHPGRAECAGPGNLRGKQQKDTSKM